MAKQDKKYDGLITTADLMKEIDKKMMVLLKDGTNLVGYLRSVDHHGNLVLEMTVERIFVGDKYGDIPRGVNIVRGENIMILGEIDKELESKQNLTQVSMEEILTLQNREMEAEAEKQKIIRLVKELRLTHQQPSEDMSE